MTYVSQNYCNIRQFPLTYYGSTVLSFPFGNSTPSWVLAEFNRVSVTVIGSIIVDTRSSTPTMRTSYAFRSGTGATAGRSAHAIAM